MTALSEIAASEFVLLTTHRKTGAPVSTPVWVVGDGDEALVTTGADSGKVKRLRHTSRVTLAPCDARGRVAEGAPSVEAVAAIHEDAGSAERLHRALHANYGVKYTLIRLGQKLRRGGAGSVALVIR